MNSQLPNFEIFSNLKNICGKIIENPKDLDGIRQLNVMVETFTESFMKIVEPTILATLYPFITSNTKNGISFSCKEKQIVIDILRNVFEKSTVSQLNLFFNIYSFLLFEIYDHKKHTVLPVSEEYKLSIMKCTKALAKSVTTELVSELYTKAHVPKLCQMLHVTIEIAKTEQLKSLRIAAMECIMCLARVYEDEDFMDVVIRKQVAEVFLFFLPGIATGLKQIALEDEKIGHAVPVMALRAWGRITTLLMQDYNASTTTFEISELQRQLEMTEESNSVKKKWTTNEDIVKHVESVKLSSQWYRDNDKKMQHLVIAFTKLTHHSHQKVRFELVEMCRIILENCLRTMPLCSSHLIEIVITLTEDEDLIVSKNSYAILNNISNSLSSDRFKLLLESLEDGFSTGIKSLPRKFNGIDEQEQMASLNLLIGYLNLFGQHKLNQVLLTPNCLNQLLMTLIHISELEKSGLGMVEEYSIKGLDPKEKSDCPWKKFCHFQDDQVRIKLEKLCSLLGNFGIFRMVSDYLLDIIVCDATHRKEAIFILNETITGVDVDENNIRIIKSIINIYTDPIYCQLPLTVSVDDYGNQITLAQAQHNAIQVSLLIDGIGKMAVILKDNFHQFMLKILYIVLERAGSSHYLVRLAGLSALKDITFSCGYSNVTELITQNIDYFSFHIERRLKKSENKENVLGVFSVVLQYSTMDVLEYLSYTVQKVLVQSCDKYKETNIKVYLEVFKVFVKSLRRWLNIQVREDPIISKAEKNKIEEEFKVTGVNEEILDDNFSDDIMGKTAEEMYEEDMKKKLEDLEKENDIPEVKEYEKPEPPLHIKITVLILQRSLNFLPSKDRLIKLSVLEILSNALEIIRDWEDELLPIVHQIWSPLVQRFKEHNEPLIINLSFQLLEILARLSKEFIRMRTSKEVLPDILIVLEKLSKDSYLKDKGSVYRYSQSYKLQVTILERLGKILIYLDVSEENMIKALNCVRIYLSNKQPLPLQTAAIAFFNILAKYDHELVSKNINCWKLSDEFDQNMNTIISAINISDNNDKDLNLVPVTS
ncbi:TELO2-interacting protein 1 homolog isoform X1 [Diorhabda carinulata]|uniref:TELO2-interacting protein 1 homolog isoform X1 n=2 Tax=Diorhabda carinulata TaxID=1163345 RepID=UPI0025A30D9E|nr:TELO2-interacting protein 1 homolog isoform X1 [Diorhabda carinulata]